MSIIFLFGEILVFIRNRLVAGLRFRQQNDRSIRATVRFTSTFRMARVVVERVSVAFYVRFIEPLFFSGIAMYFASFGNACFLLFFDNSF